MDNKGTTWLSEVSELRSFLDENKVVSEGVESISGNRWRFWSTNPTISNSWARIGVRKFSDRVIPYLEGAGPLTADQLSNVRLSITDAVSFGNSTLIVNGDGSVRITTPETSFARKDVFGKVEVWEDLGTEVKTYSKDGELFIERNGGRRTSTGAKTFTLFYQANGVHQSGQSRVTPAIRSLIKAAIRTDDRREDVEKAAAYPQKVINGVWESFGQEGSLEEEGLSELVAGVSQIIALPAHPVNGTKVDLEEFSAASVDGFLKTKEALAREVAAAFNIEPAELGVVSSNPTSAEALFISKEDLILEVEAFITQIRRTLQLFFNAVADSVGEPRPTLKFADAATPSLASQADWFSKMVTGVPELKYSRAALARGGLPIEVIEELFTGVLPQAEGEGVDHG